MSIVMGIDPGKRTPRGRYGSKLMAGQSMSGKYPGYISCGNGVFRKPSVWTNKQGRERSSNYYCIETTCTQCSKDMLQNRTNSKKSKNSFCSQDCKYAWVKANSAGRIFLKKREHGVGHHIEVKIHNHPKSGRHNKVYQHILIAEEKMGRFLANDELVHHINCVKSDNRPENLFVCKNNGEHFRIHGSLNQCVAELMALGVLIFDEVAKKYRVKT